MNNREFAAGKTYGDNGTDLARLDESLAKLGEYERQTGNVECPGLATQTQARLIMDSEVSL